MSFTTKIFNSSLDVFNEITQRDIDLNFGMHGLKIKLNLSYGLVWFLKSF